MPAPNWLKNLNQNAAGGNEFSPYFPFSRCELSKSRDTCAVSNQPKHHVLGTPISPPFPKDTAQITFGMGCFWGAERLFWQTEGVYTTAVGYAGGATPSPDYKSVCGGQTGHAEVVLVAYDPERVPLASLLKTFWESHDPTQGMRQGNDVGSQYRSVIYAPEGDLPAIERSKKLYQDELTRAGLGPITTEVLASKVFYWAEEYHQQYLSKNPRGYCGIGGTGVSCPVGMLATKAS